MDHVRLELLGEQGGPRLGIGGGDDLSAAVVVPGGDEQLGEEALVGEPTRAGAAESVDLVDVNEQVKGRRQRT
ncbi:MAG TPA: hypothetical protein VHN80_12365, partial [Kineosporiaceae bacterium]|nr:hypothetical protein [Kineosporiaceae bacterium]